MTRFVETVSLGHVSFAGLGDLAESGDLEGLVGPVIGLVGLDDLGRTSSEDVAQ